ncbi:porin family protein [Vibrio ziniensis]|uniref:Porin family protein n=1 Tax=Vibrio ziniensis TaxID=2711221 RepID=A0A6G7CPH4_9VIBR|nr:porin family protein [Vibrio ziniensis]QIH43992.1 porin family protein [Vibrio ziniensis]
MKYLGQTSVGLFLLFLALPTLAAISRHQFYANSGYNNIENSNSTESAWTTTLGYSYYLSPYVGVDFGYTDTISNGATFFDNDGEPLLVKYRSFFAGARIEQPINSYTSVYAKGGLGQTNLEESNTSFSPELSQDYSGINPYIGIGATMQPMYVEKLELSVELKFQDLQNEYSATSFTLGARFSL